MVEDGASSHKRDYISIVWEIFNPEVTAILLNGWILPIGGALAVKGLRLQPAHAFFSVISNDKPNLCSIMD